MDLCSNDHDEICHEGRQCPICELIADMKKEHEEEKDELENSISELNQQLEERNNQ